ncbi:hypothetical protein [Sinimarinibacterium sp. NLF-5-8]|uniref:hypothetical protein n=1 Tax=Sinimarinibacterium sp. NLF-5-8 TaxID=2698684 RepID=UPI00137C386F|nr:hypothetical protein [Sinimarinibacterium sp. NLF-5-8]QHS09198.1 hypothetical protein GT972_02840 [Sinimarinibacterium sp. NLF-5-8]
MQRRPSLFQNIPALLIALGIGLVGFYGQKWYELPHYSQADIDASVELNMLIEMQRRGSHLPDDDATQQRLRSTLRAEIEGQINQELKKIQMRFGLGLIALVFGVGQMISMRMMRRG